jgi:hypothetical protein
MTTSIPTKKSISWETSRIQLAVSGLLRVCAWCGKVRDEEGSWQRMEARYARETLSGRTSHGLCPECADVITRELDAAGSHAA